MAVVGIILTATTYAALTANQTIPYSGNVTAINLGVYIDSACTQNCTALSIGNVSPGGNYTQTIYVKNTGTTPETLSMTVNNWNPSNASSCLTLAWDQQNTVLHAGQSILATLTLTVGSNPGSLTDFGCSVTFTGTQ